MFEHIRAGGGVDCAGCFERNSERTKQGDAWSWVSSLWKHARPSSVKRGIYQNSQDVLAAVDRICGDNCYIGAFTAARQKINPVDYDPPVYEKLTLIARKTGRCAKELLMSSANTVMAFGDRAHEAQGFASMVCRGGKALIKDWEIGCEKTAGKIMKLQVWSSTILLPAEVLEVKKIKSRNQK